MPYYHIYIVYHTLLSKIEEACELDLNEEILIKEIVEPYLAGLAFMCNERPIDPFFVDSIRISESEKPSKELIPKIRAEEDRRAAKTGFGGGVSDEYLVVDSSQNVTRKYITHPPKKEAVLEKKERVKQPLSKNIFIVHGRDHKPMEELKTMLYEFSLNPIVLHEKASGGLTLAEKLGKYSKDAGYAFVILTPDDVGCQETEIVKWKSKLIPEIVIKPRFGIEDEIEQFFKELRFRARQNVIFEMGYFWGLLERKRVCCLLKGDVEKPSDIEGIVYVPFKDSVREVKEMIIKELEVAGYKNLYPPPSPPPY
jgi:predicted nucleotide-binding protein